MAKIQIGQGELQMAISSGDGSMQWFLDRQTGDVIFVSDDEMLNYGGFGDDENDEDDEDDLAEDDLDEEATGISAMIERHPDRFLSIPSMSSHEAFRIMERFTDSLDPGRARNALDEALRRRRPFRSFKDALAGFPDVREAWFKYEEGQLQQEAVDWLDSEGIEYELVPFVDRSQQATPEG